MMQRVTGIHAVVSIVRNNPKSIATLYTDRARKDVRLRELKTLAQSAGVRQQNVTRADLESIHRGRVHQGVVAELIEGASDEIAVPAKQMGIADLEVEDHPLLLVLDGVQDPHNLGACLRSADAAGVSAVIVPKDGACGMTDTVRRSAAGAAETVPVITVPNLARCIETLQEKRYWFYGADADGDVSYDEASYPTGTVIVSGAEGRGLRRLTRGHCDQVVSIPLLGAIESLNVSVATAIVLFEVRRQWKAAS